MASFFPRTDPAIAVAFVLSAFLMVAFQGASYTLFATFLTAMLVFTERLVLGDAYEAGLDRMAATVVGVALAFAVIGRAEFIPSRQTLETGPLPD